MVIPQACPGRRSRRLVHAQSEATSGAGLQERKKIAANLRFSADTLSHGFSGLGRLVDVWWTFFRGIAGTDRDAIRLVVVQAVARSSPAAHP